MTPTAGKHKFIVHGFSQENGKPAKITLWFDADRKLLNPEALAKSSMVGWGEWQSQFKVNTRWGPAWWVTTAGHGGYILISQTKDNPFGEPVYAVDSYSLRAYAYEFEEDCNWAILEYHDQTVLAAMVKRFNRQLVRGGSLREPYTDAYRLEKVRECLQRWNPHHLSCLCVECGKPIAGIASSSCCGSIHAGCYAKHIEHCGG